MSDASTKLKKELGLLDVYAIAVGTTISGGFFLLPGLAVVDAGPAMEVSYLLAVLPLVPALLSMAELATAMPRAGGLYYFLDRSMGPMIGTVGGLGTWLALILKTAFALIGMGAYLRLLFPDVAVIPLALGLAAAFGILNLFGAKKTGIFQIILTAGLLIILVWFAGAGAMQVDMARFAGFWDAGAQALISTTGLVVVSYVGLTKVVSVAEEVRNPERTLPLGIILGLITSVAAYAVGTWVMTGVLPMNVFAGSLTPAATAAEYIAGGWGRNLMILAAVFAFFAVANAGILSASRYPLAMSRDQILPRALSRLTAGGIPVIAILVTVALIMASLLLFDPTRIAKLASAFLLIVFALNCLAVIVMRESRIQSYDPGYRSPFYPWMHILGIVIPLELIGEMGWLPMLFTGGMILAGIAWYSGYARTRVTRDGAIYHYFARLGERRFEGLDRELRGILKEKGLRERDPFEMLVANAAVIDIEEGVDFETVVEQASDVLARDLPVTSEELRTTFLQGTRIGATPVSHGAALPHMRLPDIEHSRILLVRARAGIPVVTDTDIPGEHGEPQTVYAFFFLISPEADPSRHLRILAQIAGRVDDAGFQNDWLSAPGPLHLKELLCRDEHYLSLTLTMDTPSAHLIDRPVADIDLPEGVLVAAIHRGGELVVPRGETVLHAGDRLTFVGYPQEVRQLFHRFVVAAGTRDDSGEATT